MKFLTPSSFLAQKRHLLINRFKFSHPVFSQILVFFSNGVALYADVDGWKPPSTPTFCKYGPPGAP
jgi:hypothetical protein